MKARIKRYFITGLLVLVPLYITAYVLTIIVGFMDSLVEYLPGPLRPSTYLPFHIPGIGILITFVGIMIVGFLATNLLGRKLVSLGESIMDRIPVLRGVYKATKQFLETFFAQDHEGFRKVVLIQYPRKGLYAIGFVTGKTRGEVQQRTGEGTINIFLPTTPNPTSGFYIVVPEKDIIPLEMGVEDAFKLIMTGGMVVPTHEGGVAVKGDENEKKDRGLSGGSEKMEAAS